MSPTETPDRSLSIAMQERSRRRIPGMTQLLSKRPDQFAPGIWPGYFSRAKGAEVWDLDGNRYLDMSIGGIGATILGYADPDVDDAVREAIGKGTSSSLNCPEEVELAERLCEIHPWAGKVRFTRGGGEAMAVAVRIARAATGRDKVAFCGYHGWQDWYLAANLGDEDRLGEHLLAGLEPAGVPSGLRGTALPFRYNRLDDLEAVVRKHGDELAAIVMEPLRSSHPAEGFLSGVRRLADRCGAPLVFDEITSAFRLNTGGVHLELGLAPDMAVFSKALGNGYPIAAVLGRDQLMDAAQSTFISSTNWTERIGPVAALATIEKHRRQGVSDRLVEVGREVQLGWRRISDRTGLRIEVGGIAPLSHFAFREPEPLKLKALFVQEMIEEGFLASTDFYAMFSHTLEHVDAYLAACRGVFSRMAGLLERGAVDSALRGKPASEGFQRLT